MAKWIARLDCLWALSIEPKIPEIWVGSLNGTGHFGLVPPEYSEPALKVVHSDRSGHFGRSDRNVPFHLPKLLSQYRSFLSCLQEQVVSNGKSILYLPLTVSINWHNTTRRWKKCVYKVRVNQRIICLKPVHDIQLKQFINLAEMNTTKPGWIQIWPKHRIYLPYSSRNCFESFEYSEKRIVSIYEKFLPSLAFIGFLCEIGFLRL